MARHPITINAPTTARGITTDPTVSHSVSDTGRHLLLRSEFAVDDCWNPAVHGRHDASGKLAAQIRRVHALAVQLLHPEGAARGRVDQGEMRGSPDRERCVVTCN